MSSTLPPDGPGSGPEQLSPEPAGRPDRGSGGRRRLLVGGSVVAVAALVGGGAWAATSFFGTGAQPSEALPADTLGYVSVDLDPSGEQKIEALRTLREFPAFRDEVGLETDDDVRRYVFERTVGAEGGCPEVDYDADVEPWLGDRFAVAAVPGAGETPTPVVVVQVSDAGGAEDGLAALRACAGEDELGFVVEGDWALVAPTEEAAQDVVDAAADGALADDADFTRWADEVDAGIVGMYAAPEAGPALLEGLRSAPGFEEELSASGVDPEQLSEGFEAFTGAAGSVRFDDGGVALELAVGGEEEQLAAFADEGGAEAVRTLPDDTAAAVGLGLREGWAQTVLDQLESGAGAQAEQLLGMPFEELLAMAEEMTGLQLPEDVEALFGDSFAIAVGGDFSVQAAGASPDGSDVPVGAKVLGDAEEVQRVLGALDDAFGTGAVLGDDAEGDVVAVGPSADYREELLAGGDLGGTERFTAVVEDADEASSVLFVDLDAAWVTELVEMAAAGGDSAVADNLEPLSALGMSSRVEDGAARLVLRVTTD